MARRYTIDPKRFDAGEWREVFYATSLFPRYAERHCDAKPVKRTETDIRFAVAACLSKAARIMRRELNVGKPDLFEDSSWCEDLVRGAFALLRTLT